MAPRPSPARSDPRAGRERNDFLRQRLDRHRAAGVVLDRHGVVGHELVQDEVARVARFLGGRDDLDVGPLRGMCRGFGAITGDERRYQDTIGIYTAEGVYYNFRIDTRLECVIPQFVINDTSFF